MFNKLKKKTLEEKIRIVKQHAIDNKITCEYANLMYSKIAVETYAWDDAGQYFFDLYMKEKIHQVLGE